MLYEVTSHNIQNNKRKKLTSSDLKKIDKEISPLNFKTIKGYQLEFKKIAIKLRCKNNDKHKGLSKNDLKLINEFTEKKWNQPWNLLEENFEIQKTEKVITMFFSL
jgi:hypothetical protein